MLFLQTYMLMIGAPVGDLVQFVKTGGASRGGAGKRSAPGKSSRATAGDDDVLVSRVELDCTAYRHRKHWEGTILPRLYEFARMVYRFRGDDLLRWRYLLAAPVSRGREFAHPTPPTYLPTQYMIGMHACVQQARKSL